MVLKTHSFQILLALSEGEQHGSGIARRVHEETGGEVRLWPVTLYRSLEELHEIGLIEELAGPEQHPLGESRRRRYYRLTAAGAAALESEAERLEGMTRAVRRNLRAGKWRATGA